MAKNSEFEVGGLVFDAESGEMGSQRLSRRLEPKAAAVLAILSRADGAMVSRQELLDRCWGPGTGSDEALTQAVAQVRRTLNELGETPDLVETLARRGYRLRIKAAPAIDLAAPAQAVPRQRSRKRAAVLAAALGALALAAAWIAYPHGPRHFVRHAFGLAPQQQSSHPGH